MLILLEQVEHIQHVIESMHRASCTWRLKVLWY